MKKVALWCRFSRSVFVDSPTWMLASPDGRVREGSFLSDNFSTDKLVGNFLLSPEATVVLAQSFSPC